MRKWVPLCCVCCLCCVFAFILVMNLTDSRDRSLPQKSSYQNEIADDDDGGASSDEDDNSSAGGSSEENEPANDSSVNESNSGSEESQEPSEQENQPSQETNSQEEESSSEDNNTDSDKSNDNTEMENESEEQEESETFTQEAVSNEMQDIGINLTDISINVNNGSGTITWGSNSKWGSIYGTPNVHSYVIVPQIMTKYIVIKASPAQLEGCFDTTYGFMHFFVKGDQVFGTLDYKGRIQFTGKLFNNLLVGVWIKRFPNGTSRTGPIQFVFEENWVAFTGVWGNAGDSSLTNLWDGKRVPCPPKGTISKRVINLRGPGN